MAFLGANSAQQVAYDSAVSTLTAYLNTLTTPTAWNDKTGNTNIDSATFLGDFDTVYTNRQTLLNAIYAAAQALANAAQSTANTAQTTANTAQTTANTAQTTGTNAQNTANTALANSPLVINPNFANGLSGWVPDSSGWAATASNSPNPQISTNVQQWNGASQTGLRNSACVPCQTGDVVAVSAQIGGQSVNGIAAVVLLFYNAANTETAIWGNYIGPGTWNTSGSPVSAVNGTSRASATAPAGTVYCKVMLAVSNFTTGAYHMTGVTLALQPRSIDDVPNGTSFARTLGSRLQNGVPLMSPTGRNMVVNGGWELNNVGTPLNTVLAANAPCGDGWVATANQWMPSLNTGAHNSGAQSAAFSIGNGAVIPTGTTYGVVQSADTIPVHPGDTLYLGAFFYWNLNYAMPAGVTMSLNARIVFLDTNGNQLASPAAVSTSTQGFDNFGGSPLTVTGAVPAAACKAYFQYYMQVNNSNGSAVTIPAGNNYPVIGYCDDLFCYALTNLDTDAQDGTVNGRMAMADVYNVGGANRVGLRVAGSGQTIGDQRNLLPVTWAGVRSVLSTSPISYSISGTTVNFSVAAFTLNAGGVNIGYNASSGSVSQSAGTTVGYYLYYRDPTSAGGSMSLYITTSVQALAAYPDIVLLGSANVTVASGGGGSGGAGSGGGGYCVADDMWIDRGTLARDAALGHLFDCCDFGTSGQTTFKRPMLAVEYHVTPCVRITTEHGAVLDCGVSTPFDTVDGRTLLAPDIGGELVLTDRGLERVARVDDIGNRRVCFFHFGGISYAAGVDPGHRIYSHNPGTVKP